MNLGYFNYPLPVNEPVLNYAPGSAEKKRLKEILAELKSTETDQPLKINVHMEFQRPRAEKKEPTKHTFDFSRPIDRQLTKDLMDLLYPNGTKV